MSRAVATASAALRLVAAASRLSILSRAISTAPITTLRDLPVRPIPRYPFPADLSRGYARGRAAAVPSEDEVEEDDGDLDGVDLEDFDSEGDANGEDFIDCSDSEEFSETGSN